MRKVKVITANNSFEVNGAYEIPVNEAFAEIEENGGKILQTHYCVSEKGHIKGVIIEYEANEY